MVRLGSKLRTATRHLAGSGGTSDGQGARSLPGKPSNSLTSLYHVPPLSNRKNEAWGVDTKEPIIATFPLHHPFAPFTNDFSSLFISRHDLINDTLRARLRIPCNTLSFGPAHLPPITYSSTFPNASALKQADSNLYTTLSPSHATPICHNFNAQIRRKTLSTPSRLYLPIKRNLPTPLGAHRFFQRHVNLRNPAAAGPGRDSDILHHEGAIQLYLDLTPFPETDRVQRRAEGDGRGASKYPCRSSTNRHSDKGDRRRCKTQTQLRRSTGGGPRVHSRPYLWHTRLNIVNVESREIFSRAGVEQHTSPP